MNQTLELPTLEAVTSVIFPASPAKLNIHQVPRNAEFIAYEVSPDMLTLSAWMPDKFSKVSQTKNQSNNQFYNQHCDGCERNCYDYHMEYMDEDGDVDVEKMPGGFHCWVYDEGYHGQACPEGYEKETGTLEFNIANMVFELRMSYLGDTRFNVLGDTAYLCKGEVDPTTNRVRFSDTLMAANVFGDSDDPQGICWGSNPRPNTLSGLVSGYTCSTYNNDLLSLSAFEDNCDDIRSYSANYTGDLKYLCKDVDAIAMLDVERDLQAFFTFLIAGFNSLPEAPHIMFVPLVQGTFVLDGATFEGYKTIPDAVGRQWFITYDGQLLGQV